MIRVRPATQVDLPVITEIYNEAILSTPSTFDTEPKSLDDRRAWFALHGGLYPVLVADQDGLILGWASLSRLSNRPGWRYSVEDSVYVRAPHRGKGVGKALLERLVAEARRLGHHALIARIVSCNQSSVRLHERFGFQTVGTWREVGWKFDSWLDLLVMELIFDPGQPPTRDLPVVPHDSQESH